MPSSWNVYYVIFLSALLALSIPLILTGVSHLASTLVMPRRRQASGAPQSESVSAAAPAAVAEEADSVLGKRTNARFFLGVNAALALIALALALLPCAGMLQAGMGSQVVVRGLIAIVSLASFAALGLFYSVRKGDMRWLETYRKGAGSG